MDASKEGSAVEVFDYVIVGAGPSAMGILRGLLEEIWEGGNSSDGHSKAKLSIAVVERGDGPPHDRVTQFPERWYEAANPSSRSSKSVRLFESEITGRTMDIPVGQGLGGTSNVNACLCLSPLEQDLDIWPEPYRSSLIPNAEYLRNIMEVNRAIEHTPTGKTTTPFSTKDSMLEFFPTVPTMAAKDKVSNRMIRTNYYDALVEPFLKEHPSLENKLYWYRGYEAQRLIVKPDNATRVIGIECTPTCRQNISFYRTIRASKRVILCAGAIETPALLLVSNLGDKEPLLGVGQNLRDQALLARVFMKFPSLKSNKLPKSPNGIAALGHLHVKEDAGNGGCQTFQVAITDSVANASIIPSVVPGAMRWKCKTKIFAEMRDILFCSMKAVIRFAILFTPLGIVLSQLTTTTMIFLVHPISRGSVTIRLKKSLKREIGEPKRRKDVYIDANPRYLDDTQDAKNLKTAWDSLGRMSSSSFELFPSLLFSVLKLLPRKNLWFESYCSYFLLPYYHFSGTCAMVTNTKNNPNWVVDPSLKVRGHDGLYICDASVFPSMISNPPALTCAALGYTFARSNINGHENEN